MSVVKAKGSAIHAGYTLNFSEQNLQDIGKIIANMYDNCDNKNDEKISKAPYIRCKTR